MFSPAGGRRAQTVLVLGAASAIAREIARRLARDGDRLILAGRDLPELERSAADLRARFGAAAAVKAFDALAFDAHAAFFADCTRAFPGGVDGVILCYGFMTSQAEAARDFAAARRMIETNYVSAVSVLNLAADYLERRGAGGYVCAISSVAADRGRQSNYVYGSSKAALSTYLQGLRNRLTPAGVTVVTVKPGFVDTPMTWGLPGLFLVATPRRVAADIVRAIRRRRAEIYSPWFWRGIMAIIKMIPEPVFRRMKL